MKEKKVASLKIVFEDGSDYSVACEKGLDKDELAEYIERAFKPEPAEPLIKDEKVRKAVRAWAEMLYSDKIWVARYDCMTIFRDEQTGFRLEIVADVPKGEYTIAELCGEDE